MLEKILLPLDGSTLAEAALPHALALAAAASARAWGRAVSARVEPSNGSRIFSSI